MYHSLSINSSGINSDPAAGCEHAEHRTGAGSNASLGNIHEFTQPPPSPPLYRQLDKDLTDPDFYRLIEQYELQRIAADLLRPFKLRDRSGNLQLPRVCKCLQVPRTPAVEIWKSIEHEKFFYGGLVICGSVWDCLPCARKISERRKVEIKQGIDIWEGRGGSVLMMTLTFPHYEHQATGPLLMKFGESRRKMRNRKSWKRTADAMSIVGRINRVETTYGANGAHIHCHELLFSEHQNLKVDAGSIYPMWASSCVDSGLDAPSEEHGVKISTPEQMADYVSKIGKEGSKWSLELEMTKGHIKQGKIDGMTPFDLLRAFRDTGNSYYSEKFIEYSQAFKQKTQLKWSDGLRDLLGLAPEKTDIEVAEEKDALSEIFSLIDLDTWKFIRKYNLRGDLIAMCKYGIEAVLEFLTLVKKGGIKDEICC